MIDKEIRKRKIKDNFVMNTYDYVRCTYEWVKNSGSTIDWIVLTNVLKEEWESFGLIGIKFNNGSAFKKAIGITTGLIAVFTYIIDFIKHR